MLLVDADAKTIRLPVRFIEGRFINQITGVAITEIKHETPCEIIVNANKITDDDLLIVLGNETDVDLVKEGTVLLAQVGRKDIPSNMRQFAVSPDGMSSKYDAEYVEIELREPLVMKFRGSKQPQLKDCECYIRSIDQIAKSINHAYSLISTAFEPKRRSHTGNVFQKVFYSYETRSQRQGWHVLNRLRSKTLFAYGEYLAAKYREMKNKQQADLFQQVLMDGLFDEDK
jgi:hypothetical protein